MRAAMDPRKTTGRASTREERMACKVDRSEVASMTAMNRLSNPAKNLFNMCSRTPRLRILNLKNSWIPYALITKKSCKRVLTPQETSMCAVLYLASERFGQFKPCLSLSLARLCATNSRIRHCKSHNVWIFVENAVKRYCSGPIFGCIAESEWFLSIGSLLLVKVKTMVLIFYVMRCDEKILFLLPSGKAEMSSYPQQSFVVLV